MEGSLAECADPLLCDRVNFVKSVFQNSFQQSRRRSASSLKMTNCFAYFLDTIFGIGTHKQAKSAMVTRIEALVMQGQGLGG